MVRKVLRRGMDRGDSKPSLSSGTYPLKYEHYDVANLVAFKDTGGETVADNFIAYGEFERGV